MSRTVSTPRRSTSPIRPNWARTALDGALDRLCDRAEAAVHGGYNILILSDRTVGADRIPIPALLATAAVHHHLIRKGLRTSVGLVVETGEAREVHHFACLAGYGAEAINPYLAFETLLEHDSDETAWRSRRRRGRQALHQGDRQGPAEGDVQDGHLDLPVLLRRADLRRRRPVSGLRRRSTSPAPRPRSRASAWTRSPRRRCGATATPSATTRSIATRSTSAASTPTACAARTMSGRPTRSRRCSMRCAATSQDDYREFAELINEQDERLHDDPRPVPHQDCGGDRARAGAARRGRAGDRDRQALRDRRDVASARSRARRTRRWHRHEPDRRQVEHRRGRRGAGALPRRCRTAIRCARRSSRSPRAASASRPSTSSTPT